MLRYPHAARGRLEAKAPQLWPLAHSAGVTFNHVQEYAEVALGDLHRAFSKAYLHKSLNSGKAAVEAERGAVCDPAWFAPPNLSAQELYGLRRDAEGVPSLRRGTAPSRCEGMERVLGCRLPLIMRLRPGPLSTQNKSLRFFACPLNLGLLDPEKGD